MPDLEGKKRETKHRKPEHSFLHIFTGALKVLFHHSLEGRVETGLSQYPHGQALLSSFWALSGGLNEASMVNLIGQHCTLHTTAKPWTLRGSKEEREAQDMRKEMKKGGQRMEKKQKEGEEKG